MISNRVFHFFLTSQCKKVNVMLHPQLLNIRCVQHYSLPTMSTKVSQTQIKESFQDLFPSVLKSVSVNKDLSEVPEAGDWVKKVLEYNLAGGKKARGLTTLFAYEMLEKPENITEESIYSAKIMGWCVEMLQAYGLVLDDIMDGSTTRRGVPCWFRRADVGLGAINDAQLIYNSLFHLLRTHFGRNDHYTKMIELFNETLFRASIGEHLDMTTTVRRHKSDYSLFTIERYNAIAKYKTAYITYKLPVCLGMLLANNADPVMHKQAEEMCAEIGKFFQMQDDYIDCYGDESVSGKAGTDIQEAKCSWLAVTALSRCTPAQRTVFAACYGSPEPAHIYRIKDLYQILEIPNLYAQEEARLYESLVSRANALPSQLSPALFVRLIDMIYKRKH